MGWVARFFLIISLFQFNVALAAPFKSSICQTYLLAMHGPTSDVVSLKKETRNTITFLNGMFHKIDSSALSSQGERKAARAFKEIVEDYRHSISGENNTFVAATLLRGHDEIDKFLAAVKKDEQLNMASDQRKIFPHEFQSMLLAGGGGLVTTGSVLSMYLTQLVGQDLRPFQVMQAAIGAVGMMLGSDGLMNQIFSRNYLHHFRDRKIYRYVHAEPEPREWEHYKLSTLWNPATLKAGLESGDHNSEITQQQMKADVTPTSFILARRYVRRLLKRFEKGYDPKKAIPTEFIEPEPLRVKLDRFLTFETHTEIPLMVVVLRAKSENNL